MLARAGMPKSPRIDAPSRSVAGWPESSRQCFCPVGSRQPARPFGASGEMAIIAGNRDAELVLQRSSRFRIRFADNNLLRSTKFLQEKAANDRTGELTSSDKTKLIGLFAHL